MAVDSTPDRSLSDLLSSSRAAGDDGMNAGLAEMGGLHHRRQRRLDRPLRVGQEGGDAGQRLVLLGIEDMQDRADQQRVRGLSQWFRFSRLPSGSTSTSAMFCTSRTSHSPRRTSSSGL
jgi:hypothetical protein